MELNLARKKRFTFREEEYEIEFPTVGQYLEIEDQKIVNSYGHWLELIQSKTISALRSVQIIECISILKVLCPKLIENLKVTSYKSIDTLDFVELLSLYQKVIYPWYNKWFEAFNQVLIETSQIEEEYKESNEN